MTIVKLNPPNVIRAPIAVCQNRFIIFVLDFLKKKEPNTENNNPITG